ncbi:3-deoxy-manno-octulosonate cytidylyltransferase [Paenibacillus sacheonensis]|uniref:3-deoxy-manno-octulosonate cytidylyltransferase n=1 Tax=Paenibacillus sacheonensis TaxID=742054 RepID=A0A7X5BZZ4_9BACL|nr:3-deoxy-manno-octulosonate cytidylyltransferase [Paenibacillus sacheonensis]MBM7567981.1 3-deoxy-manno-octulosonate cytidylyltransferase (CMP-KDO synthetase) [Paenibacillus sacheonensis]NBC73188.1 3-deoxy-manno-octulosonate cytidylyltransferase [Paenibacillus sacheonensis]
MKIVAVIPARYNSSRFLAKPLADIFGKPMIWWVYEQVKKVNEFNEVYVATDDDRIAEICTKYNLNYIMTSTAHGTSTERLFEVAQSIGADYYVCINGDEPLIDPEIIRRILPINKTENEIYVANLMSEIKNPVEAVDSTNIKVVVNSKGYAMFMSRSPIPYPKSSMDFSYKKHLGVLVYNYLALEFFNNTQRNAVEKVEDINELRFIENGEKIKMIEVVADTLSVDTPKDLEKVIAIIEERLQIGGGKQ